MNPNQAQTNTPLSPMRHQNSPQKPSSNYSLMGPLAQYIDAVSAVYSPSVKPNTQAQANKWLQHFSSSKEAWGVCQDVVTSTGQPKPSAQIMFFTLNILYNKIRREWVSVPTHQKASITTALFQLARAIASPPSPQNPVVNFDNTSVSRLCLCLGAIASFQSNGVEMIVQLSMQTFQQMPRGLLLAMESLVAIIDEVKESDRVRVQSLDLELQVKQQLPGVAKLLNHLLATNESPISIAYILHNSSSQTPSNISNDIIHNVKIALKALQRWFEQGVSISEFYETYNDLFNLMKKMVLHGPSQLLEYTINVSSHDNLLKHHLCPNTTVHPLI